MLKINFTFLMMWCSIMHAQDTLQILFSYGSKPNTKAESKWFGGIHGGHVSISYKGGYASFVPAGGFHIFSHNKNKKSVFAREEANNFIFDTANSRYLILYIPVDKRQSNKVDSIISQRIVEAPYDYAFFGMRCASAAYEVLSGAGIYPKYSLRKMSIKYFYPKLLRKEIYKEVRAHSWKYFYRAGRKSRKWESD
ncbi:MAG: hypothetical protein PSX81_00920 [bacterium]|nr:hypothetical protein [bacterium]